MSDNLCPVCEKPTDNGHDRRDPPNAYVCSGCVLSKIQRLEEARDALSTGLDECSEELASRRLESERFQKTIEELRSRVEESEEAEHVMQERVFACRDLEEEHDALRERVESLELELGAERELLAISVASSRDLRAQLAAAPDLSAIESVLGYYRVLSEISEASTIKGIKSERAEWLNIVERLENALATVRASQPKEVDLDRYKALESRWQREDVKRLGGTAQLDALSQRRFELQAMNDLSREFESAEGVRKRLGWAPLTDEQKEPI